MSRSDVRRFAGKLVTLCLLLIAMTIMMSRAEESAKAAWCPICPVPYSCDWSTGDCVCDCPNPIDGSCPVSCA